MNESEMKWNEKKEQADKMDVLKLCDEEFFFNQIYQLLEICVCVCVIEPASESVSMCAMCIDSVRMCLYVCVRA